MAGDGGDEGREEKKLEKYSVLMSVYAKEKPEYLAESLNSMLLQTVKPDQIVLVCDGPLTDGLNKIVEQFRSENPELLHVERLEKCGGLGLALNAGLLFCRNQLVARMDSDDISMKERCERQLQMFSEKKADIVGGGVSEFTGDCRNVLVQRILPETDGEIRRFLKRRNPFNHPCVMYRKEKVIAAGGYLDFPYFEDYYLWARMLKMGAVGYNIQESILYMRAGQDMYARRGGLNYAKLAVKFRWYLKKTGVASFEDFLVSAGGQLLMCILPNGWRRVLYKKILRK